MYDSRENEHQELFYPGIDPRQPIDIHIPSPLGRLPYYVFVRVPAAAVERLDGVSMRVDVGGLRPDHLDVAPGEDVRFPAVSAGAEGYAWRCLGLARVSRGDGTLVLRDWPADMNAADMLICTWPRFVQSGLADAWLAAQADPAWAPSGVPLGGIGCGRVDLCRDGRFRNFSMNNNQDAPVEDPDGLPGAYLGVTVGGTTVDLASRPIIAGHEACSWLEYEPRFPQATLRAREIVPGLDVTATLSGPLCPHDLRRAGLPGVLVRWTVTNHGDDPCTVAVRMGWPNLIGVGGGIAKVESGIGYGDGFYHHWDDPTGRAQSVLNGPGYHAVRYTGTPAEAFRASAGEHLLAVVDGMALVGSPEHGEVMALRTVPAGGTVQVTMALVAAMPYGIDSLGIDRGHAWQNDFADGEAVLVALLAEADDILAEAGALVALLADSTLPGWLQRRLSNCAYPLVTNSVFYRDGRFSINEGPTEMAGCYGTIDQRLAAHPATQLLFPQLNVTELSLFAANQAEDGGINHDLGGGHLERGVRPQDWPDLTCSFIIQTARHAWSTGDAAFEAAMWPRARKALLKHAAWAEEGQGVAQVGHSLGTSYDGYHYVGTTGYMATLWLAALAVMECWAGLRGDAELLACIPGWRDAAVARLDADLWNGDFYIAYGEQGGVRRESCHAGQLAGQVFTRLLTGGDVLPVARLDACLDAIFRLNGSDAYAVPPDEVWADGSSAAEFGWLPYVEGFMLTAAATRADARLLPLWERMMAAVDGEGAHPCDTRLMYRPRGGEPSWGAYYMTAPASWLVYDAWLDFFYTPADGALRLRVPAPGRYPVVHPLFWGTLDAAADGTAVLTVSRTFADGLRFTPPAGVRVAVAAAV